MNNDADYELWAAMMADDEPVAAPAPVLPLPPVAQVPDSDETVVAPVEIVEPTIEEISSVSYFEPTIEEINDDVELDFPTNLFKEPQTNSILITEVPDALSTEIVTESGEILKTGAIDIPILNNTGSIPIITSVPETIDEEAINADMGDETTGGIPPIRARSVMNSSARVGVLPIKNRRSEGQTILLVTTSVLLVTLGAAVLALYMLEIIR